LKQAAQVVNVDLVAEYPGGSVVPDYVTSASNLYFARDGEFDFVCSSHVLEHLSNPILALREWMRVIKYDGIVYCGVPDKRFTFDHKRKRTALQHLVKDYKQNVSTEDLTHLYDFYFNYDYRLARINRETVLKQVLDYYSSTKMGKLLCFSFTIMFS
jgi:predicted SAM-dependent methyltransferase